MIKSKLVTLLTLCLTLNFISCSSDDSSSDDNGGSSDDCGIEVLSATEITEGEQANNFTFRIKNGDAARTGISVDIKYFKDNVVVGSGVGASASNIDADETVEFTTITTNITSAEDYDCTEYVVKVFNQTSICEVKGPECN